MVSLIKRLWQDPVLSKLIAQGLIWLVPIAVAVSPTFFPWLGIQFNWPAPLFIALALLGVLGALIGAYTVYRNQRRLDPATTVVSITIPDPPSDRNPPLTYPLKCYVTLRNDSKECAEIRLSEYKPRTVPIKAFPLNVLQVNFGRQWYPQTDGADRVALLPSQLCRAWIGLNDELFTPELAARLLLTGQVGTLIFLVNGKSVSVELKHVA
jgi:hypothetical protein